MSHFPLGPWEFYWQCMPQWRALLTWWWLSWYGLLASLEQLPTKCTRALAHLSVVSCTSFQNTVSFPVSFGEPVSCCLFLSPFLPALCGGVFASNLLKCFLRSPSIPLISFLHNPLFPLLIVKPVKAVFEIFQKDVTLPKQVSKCLPLFCPGPYYQTHLLFVRSAHSFSGPPINIPRKPC